MKTRQPPRRLGESQPAVPWGTPRPFAPRRLARPAPSPATTIQRVVTISQGMLAENGLAPQGNIPLQGRWIKFEMTRWNGEPAYRAAILYLYKPYQAPAFLFTTEHDIPLETLTGPLTTVTQGTELDMDEGDEVPVSAPVPVPAPVPAPVPVKWYEPLGGDPAETLARRLQAAYEGKGNDLYDGSSMGGVIRVVERGNLDQYRDLGAFLAAVDAATKWKDDGGGLEDYFARREKFAGITPVIEIPYSKLRELSEKQVEVTDRMYDSPYVMIDQAIWTDGMGPCITIAMTATLAGKRYNTLLHSMDLGVEGKRIVTAIEKTFDGRPPLPSFAALEGKKFFIVGGSYETLGKANSILSELLDRSYDVTQAITAEPGRRKLTKALLMTSAGAVVYSAYDAKP